MRRPPPDLPHRTGRPHTSRPLCRRALLLLTLAAPGCATGLGEPLPGPPKGRIALFRGIGEISTGLDDLARRLREGGYAATVHSHLARGEVTERLLRLSTAGRLPRPLCIGGHSLGADAAIGACARLAAEGLATEELVTLDPVLVGDVEAGPQHVLNFYQAGNGFGRPLRPGPGFAGTIENIDLAGRAGLGHFNMDADQAIHWQVIARIAALRRAALAGPPEPPSRRPTSQTAPGRG